MASKKSKKKKVGPHPDFSKQSQPTYAQNKFQSPTQQNFRSQSVFNRPMQGLGTRGK